MAKGTKAKRTKSNTDKDDDEDITGEESSALSEPAAEDEARSQGCTGVFLSTFSFQARPFYERFGYEIIADVPDYPAGHTYHVLKKTLRGG